MQYSSYVTKVHTTHLQKYVTVQVVHEPHLICSCTVSIISECRIFFLRNKNERLDILVMCPCVCGWDLPGDISCRCYGIMTVI